MKEVVGDLWTYHAAGEWVAITTNGTVKSNGALVMGRGVARQARDRFPGLDVELGRRVRLTQGDPHLSLVQRHRLIAFPVKYAFYNAAEVDLIKRSAAELVELLDENEEWLAAVGSRPEIPLVYMVRPGCGNGGLDWAGVKTILDGILDDRFIVVERNPAGR